MIYVNVSNRRMKTIFVCLCCILFAGSNCSSSKAIQDPKVGTPPGSIQTKQGDLVEICESRGHVHDSRIEDITSAGVYAIGMTSSRLQEQVEVKDLDAKEMSTRAHLITCVLAF